MRGSIGTEFGTTGQPTAGTEASGPTYRNQKMIRDVSTKLTNIRNAVHEFAAETSLWTEELLHAEGSGVEGVEMVAGALSNITCASKRHLLLAISEDFDGFIQDLDNFTGPMRVQTGSAEDRKRQRRDPSDDDPQTLRPRRSCQDARYDEFPPDTTSYNHPQQLRDDTTSIVQQRVEDEQRRSIEESSLQHQGSSSMDIDDEDIRRQHQWAMEQHPTIGVRWSEQCDHLWATIIRPQGCYLCGDQHDRKTCSWRNIFEDPPGQPLLGDLLLGKGYEYDAKGGREGKGSVVPKGQVSAPWDHVASPAWVQGSGKGFRDRGPNIGGHSDTQQQQDPTTETEASGWRPRSHVAQQQFEAREKERIEGRGKDRYYEKGSDATNISETVAVWNIKDSEYGFWDNMAIIGYREKARYTTAVRERISKRMSGRIFIRFKSAEDATSFLEIIPTLNFTSDKHLKTGAAVDYKFAGEHPVSACNISMSGDHQYNFAVRDSRAIIEIPKMLIDIDRETLDLDRGLTLQCSFCEGAAGQHRVASRHGQVQCPELLAIIEETGRNYRCEKHLGGCGVWSHHHTSKCYANKGIDEFRIASMGHYQNNPDGSPSQYCAPAWYFD